MREPKRYTIVHTIWVGPIKGCFSEASINLKRKWKSGGAWTAGFVWTRNSGPRSGIWPCLSKDGSILSDQIYYSSTYFELELVSSGLQQITDFSAWTGMPIDTIALEKAVKRAIPVTHLEIEDQSSGCGENYSIVLVSEASLHSTI